MRERDIERALVKRIKALGGEVRKVRWVGRRHAPDRRVMLKDNCHWVELKAPGKFPTAAQYREMNRMRRNGERVLVVNDLDGIDIFFPRSRP